MKTRSSHEARALQVLLSGCFVLSFSCVGLAQTPPGLGLDETLEKRLQATCRGIYDELSEAKVDYSAIAEKLTLARRDANVLLGLAEGREPIPVDGPQVPARAPLIIPEGASAQLVRQLWKEQLLLRVRAVYEMLSGETLVPLPHWSEVITVGWQDQKNRAKRATPTASALREAQVLTLLLSRESDEIPVIKSEVFFEDDFTKGPDQWYLYGAAETTQTADGLRRRNLRERNADTMMWTKREFEGNFLFEFTFVPHNTTARAGALFAICGRPVREGTDLSVSCGETMDSYNYGVHAYHFSIHRGTTGVCNGRKVGTGLHLIASRVPDPATEAGRTYRVAVGKWENVVFSLVDGILLHNYFDGGTFGPVLAKGSCGMRNWGGLDATYGSVKAYRLVRRNEK